MKSILKLALVQQACNGNREHNLAVSVEGVRAAKAKGADLVMLPELHLGPYFCQTEDCGCFDGAEPIPGPTTAELASVARELGIVVVASLFERRAPGLYHNTAVVLDSDGSLAGKYRKMHIPDDPGYYEKFYFTPGDLGFRPIDTSVGRLGLLVCWDQWYPEAARLMALAGADLLLYPTAIGWNPADDEAERSRQLEAWITVQRGHAVANGLTVAACNRIGSEPDPSGQTPGIVFWGNSFAAGPQGEFLCRAGSTDAELLMVAVDRKRSEDVRRIWPFLRDRRIDSYDGLLRRYLD
ncbi:MULTISPECIES: carbon-nitrogen hydrolase [Methylococcus]|uniref:Carbon-nitrogen hydrolase n=1 Tax=Methylococcus capsulatus TaxID=414 RepID=A0ABZ2F3M5_METCP|nr:MULTISPECIES: carbon-nitrogen hydrolase [Methylococcus]MDF9393524.1 carbon-nitrogen hydrolase [Methylococcus capsulatus]